MRYTTVVVAFVLTTSPCVAQSPSWENVCPEPGVSYCNDVGKDAYNATGSQAMRNVRLGEIIGVTWRPKGSVIGISPAIPAAGIPEEVRLSPRNAYYYIIDDGGGPGKAFLRQCREIQAKDPGGCDSAD